MARQGPSVPGSEQRQVAVLEPQGAVAKPGPRLFNLFRTLCYYVVVLMGCALRYRLILYFILELLDRHTLGSNRRSCQWQRHGEGQQVSGGR